MEGSAVGRSTQKQSAGEVGTPGRRNHGYGRSGTRSRSLPGCSSKDCPCRAAPYRIRRRPRACASRNRLENRGLIMLSPKQIRRFANEADDLQRRIKEANEGGAGEQLDQLALDYQERFQVGYTEAIRAV